MSGLEVPAFVIGLSGLAAMVDKTLLLFQSLEESKSFGETMATITRKINWEFYRFWAWARASGAFGNQSGVVTRTKPEPRNQGQPGIPADNLLRAPIEDTVVQIINLLEEICNITAKYRPREARKPSTTATKSAQAPSIALGLSTPLPLLGVRHNQAVLVASTERQGRIDFIQRQVPFRLRVSFNAKAWGDTDKSLLEEKMKELTYCNDRLESILPSRIRESLDSQGRAAQILAYDDMETLEILKEAAKDKNEGVRTHARLWEERIEFAGKWQSQRHVDVDKYRGKAAALTESPGLLQSKSCLSLQLLNASSSSGPTPVAVEWHSYDSLGWSVDDIIIARARLAELVHLSRMNGRPQSLRLLNTVCFVERDQSLALVYELPENTSPTAQPVSLHQLIIGDVRTFRRPNLEQRHQLARSLASALYSFGLVRWFHKDFNSHNVAFFPAPLTGAVSIEQPFVVGLSFSRPDSTQEKSLNKDLDELEVYLHPDLRVKQGAARPQYKRAYDIYSLGLVLYEIGVWKPIVKAIGTSGATMNPETFKKTVVDRCTKDLGFFAGSKYRDITLYCLTCGDDKSNQASSLDRLYWEVVLELAKLC
ncbi:hypothetical protein B0I35DRAFT_440806 [Stachybotrys elegans]|uniref:Prion-inhibition and propagation HeLo domain-containing protein n=1 Tax=Stachybotrys elegans TaxID=80388 RepID=A0A8K0SN03_9HYPO|nr:hypothetical protein B0I35DRAFT_440806 [Stachybotrys elegans]